MQITNATYLRDTSLSVKAHNCLVRWLFNNNKLPRGTYATVWHVVEYVDDLRVIRNCGEKTAQEIIQFFAANGYAEKAQHWAEFYKKSKTVTLSMKNTTYKLFVTKDARLNNAEYIRNACYFSVFVRIKSILCHVTKIRDGEKEYLMATLKGGDEINLRSKSGFECTLLGFQQACEWLDTQRIAYAKSLL